MTFARSSRALVTQNVTRACNVGFPFLPAHFYHLFHRFLAFKELIFISDLASNLAINVTDQYLKFFIGNANNFNVITPSMFCM